MKIFSSSNNKKTLTLSKKEWQDIGKKAGWNTKVHYTGEHTYFDDQLKIEGQKNFFNVDYTGYWTYKDDSDYSAEGYGQAYVALKNKPDYEELNITEYNLEEDFIRNEKQIEKEDPALYEKILKVCRNRSELDERYIKED